MPLTAFQIEVLRVIAAQRSVESHVAGGLVLNAAAESARFSKDIDLFHDAEEAVLQASEKDCASLEVAGCSVERLLWQPGFRRAWVARNSDGVLIEWARDAAWRFFPVERDPVLQWRLHPFDALTNKALAMGARAETRDLVDIVSHCGGTRLAAVVWAACAKDPGFTPLLLLEQMRRNARVDTASLKEMGSTIAPVDLKTRWLELAERTEREILSAAEARIELGCAFVQPDGSTGWFTDREVAPHRASLGGIVPRLRPE